MLNENAQAWVKALRSGEYAQGFGKLRLTKTNEFCCLGVACELAIKAGLPIERVIVGEAVFYDAFDGSLPPKVRDWLGLRTFNGAVNRMDKHSLAHMNDAGESFTAIADFIESEPEGLFDA